MLKENRLSKINNPNTPKKNALLKIAYEKRAKRLRRRFIFQVLALVSITSFSFVSLGFIPNNSTSFKEFKNWGLYNLNPKSHIQAIDAWTIEKGSSSVIVAVIDTGIDPTHKDLSKNLWIDPEKAKIKKYDIKPLTKANAQRITSRTQNNYKLQKDDYKLNFKYDSEIFGWNFVTNTPNPMDSNGHGTHIAGIIGAISDAKAGIAGVAQNVSIMSVKYYSEYNSGSVNLTNTVKAIHYAIDHGAKIINYSGGGAEFSEEEYLAIKRAENYGILLIAAAGNKNENTDMTDNRYFPAAYNLSNIISVAAIDINGQLLKSSNWGKESVDVVAPGENIYSTMPNNKFDYMTGTSQATAFVSGIAALLLSHDPKLTPQQIKAIITSSVDVMPHLKNKIASSGKVNAYSALIRLRQDKHETTPQLMARKTASLIDNFLH